MHKLIKAPVNFIRHITPWQWIFWSVISSLIILSFVGYIWLTLVREQPKVVSGINLYRFPITVELANQTFNLDVFDSFSTTVNDSGDVLALIKDKTGSVIAAKTYSLPRQASIVMDFYSQDNTVKECFIEANVTKLFFPDSGLDSSVTKITTLQSKPASSLNYVIGDAQDFYLHFGNYNGSDLPSSIKSYLQVRGIYPVDCANLGDLEKLKAEIVWWSNYSPARQRELYQEELQQVVSSKEYTQ